MNAYANPECTTACESSWTLYLDNSSKFIDATATEEDHKDKHYTSSGEEDLSMLSDASSAPPHFTQQNNASFYSVSNKSLNKLMPNTRTKTKRHTHGNQCRQDQHLPSFLHDTATSPLFQNNGTETNPQTSTGSMLDYSQGFSATYFQGRSSYQEGHFGYLQPSLSENELGSNKWYGGKGMRMR